MPSETMSSNRKTDDPRPSRSVRVDWKVTRRFADDLLVTAFDPGYGGALYWCEVDRYHPQGRWAVDEDNNRSVEFHDEADPHVIYTFGYEQVVTGLQRAVERGWMNVAKALVEDDGGQIDAELADIVVQLSVFNEVRYS